MECVCCTVFFLLNGKHGSSSSWGEDWGMDGYIKMAKDRDNNCGIATYAIYPTV
jgi:hypothetical protein